MWGNGWNKWVWLIFFEFLGINSLAQDTTSKYSIIKWPVGSPADKEQLVKAWLTQDLDYYLSLSAFQFINWNHGKKDNLVSFQQSLKYHVVLSKTGIFSLSNTIVHDLGFRFFYDSIMQVHPDETVLSTRLTANFFRKMNIQLNSEIATRLFNNFEYMADDQGRLARILTSSWMTPLSVTISLGLAYSWPGFGELNLGLSGVKITHIRDTGIFERMKIQSFYGIPRGKNHRVEYGLSLRLLVDRDLWKRVHWTCDLLLFKNALSPMDFSLKNLFGIRLSRFLKTSIQTRILYEEKTSKNLRLENLVNIGFSVNF